MQNGQAFVGFHEAPIDFPPTFKYDVLRTLKRAKRRSRPDRQKQFDERVHQLTEAEEKELQDAEDEGDEEGEGGEAASMASSVWTSIHSRAGTDREIEDDDEFPTSPSSHTMSTSGSKVSIYAAAHKAKAKWLSMISSSSPTIPTKQVRSKQVHGEVWLKKNPLPSSTIDVVLDGLSASVPERATSLDAVDRSFLHPPPMVMNNPTKSSQVSDEEEGDEKGVYDSSHKKRVPSWCAQTYQSIPCVVG